MGVAEYFLGMMAIVSGLALTDMVSSLHGLLRRFRKVRWDFLPMSTAAIIFLAIIYGWFVSWNSRWEGMPFWILVVAILQLTAVFLAAKAVLPDDDGSEEEVDLLAHYRRSNRYVWLATGALSILIIVSNMSAAIQGGGFDRALGSAIPHVVYLVLSLGLAAIQKIWLHRMVVPVILIALGLLWGGQMLTGTV